MGLLHTRENVRERAGAREREDSAGAEGPARTQAADPAVGLRADPAARAPELDPLDEFFWREDEVAPALLDVIGGASLRAPAEAPEVRREWLAFMLSGEEYAIAIEQVCEILKAPVITEVPRAPAHVLGVIMVRGEVIAVLDLRCRLGLPAAAAGRQARVIVCDAGEGPRGFLVDAVSDVVRLPPSAVEARPSGIPGPAAECIAGIGRQSNRLLILLDLPAVLGDVPPAPPPEAS
jgi:purine-binding chemotaxis protein CheW